MRVREITNSAPAPNSNGVKAGAGGSSNTDPTKAVVLQFPAARAASGDKTPDLETSDLYKNGLLFTAHTLTNRKTNTVKSFRRSKNTRLTSISNGVDKNTVAKILLPRSLSDSDIVSHKYGDVQDSKFGRGDGTLTGMASHLISQSLFSAIDSVTGGAFADNSEHLYTATRSTYQGADKRTKVYTWNLIPRTAADLKQIIAIYQSFCQLSYGTVGSSDMVKRYNQDLKNWYAKAYNTTTGDTLEEGGNDIYSKAASILSNINVVSNPTVWMVQNFYSKDEPDFGKNDDFGPAQIQSIRFDKAPDGNFNGLSSAPNMSGSYVLEVTMKEVVSLDRASIFGS